MIILEIWVRSKGGGPKPLVALHVLGELGLLLEGLTALFAIEGLVSRVDPEVVAQIAALVEGFGAAATDQQLVEPSCSDAVNLPLLAGNPIDHDIGGVLGNLIYHLAQLQRISRCFPFWEGKGRISAEAPRGGDLNCLLGLNRSGELATAASVPHLGSAVRAAVGLLASALWLEALI